MTMKLESRHLLIVGKIVSTILLLGITFIWTLFLIVILPMIMFVMNHGQNKKQNPFSLSMAMIPAGFCGLLIWRIWYPRWNPNTIDSKKYDVIRKYIPAPSMKRPIR